MLNRKLSVEEDFRLISDDLIKIFSPNFLNDLVKKRFISSAVQQI